MSQQDQSSATGGGLGKHPTTRRGFVTTISFGVISLYGLWAAYGAAPTSLSFLSEGAGAGEGGMAGMGHGGGGSISPEEFRRLTLDFVEANTLPDGSVKPVRHAMAAMSGAEEHGREDETAHRRTEVEEHGQHEQNARRQAEAEEPDHGAGGHGREQVAATEGHGPDAAAAEERHEPVVGTRDKSAADPRMRHAQAPEEHHEALPPIDVYVMASRYGYDPDLLRLEVGERYRFRFMAVDADHGASINLRLAGHMIRCPARTLVEKQLIFTKPGQFMVYCTVYCGEGHDMMMGKIAVA